MADSSGPLNILSGLNTLEFLSVHTDPVTGHRSLIANRAFRPDEVISDFYWTEVYDTPNYLTIQIGDNEHVELIPDCLECTNHSCDPNAFFDTTGRQLLCIRPIAAGEEITFFYPSAEWDMGRPFDCHCNQPCCIGHIAGARYLTEEQRAGYRFTDFIRQKLLEK